MANPNIVEVGIPTRWQPGQSPNPGGRPRLSSVSRKVREILGNSGDLMDAVRVVEMAEGPTSIDRFDLESLTNSDLVARAVLGIALNRTGRVGVRDQLAAITLLWAYMDGKPAERKDMIEAGEGEDGTARPVISVDDFRRAMGIIDDRS